MKAVFVHSTMFNKNPNSNLYYSETLPYTVFKRYLEFFDEITVIGREKEVDENLTHLSLASGEKVCFRLSKNFKSTKDIYKYFKIKQEMKETIRECDCAIIRLPSILGNIAVQVCKQLKKPYMIEMVGCPWDAFRYYGTTLGKVVSGPITLINKYQVKYADYVIYVSRRFLQKRYPTNGKNVGCPDVVLNVPDEANLEKRIEKISKTKNNKLINLGLIGSLNVAYRGHETAIKCLSIINKTDENHTYNLKFLGGGNKEKWIEMAKEYGVESNIEFCSTLPSGEPVFRWLDDIDILVMPTQQETLGRAVIEAMSRACPVLGSIETAIPEQLGSDCVFKAKDYRALANLILNMTEDTEYMSYCAKENFYRSFKYTEKRTDKIRRDFFNDFTSFVERS